MIRSQILVLLLSISVFAPWILIAEEKPYVGLEARPIKALGSEQIAGYQQGNGMGLALAAELNGYPGPKHVLELSGDLGLTLEQRHSVQDVYNDMHLAAIDLGEQIVERERELDELFANGTIDELSLRSLLTELASLQGGLRNLHLGAHLDTKSLLTDDQVDSYGRMRGYGSDSSPEHQHHPGHSGP
jgi:Spy/CpxP family protein refolding chaperone